MDSYVNMQASPGTPKYGVNNRFLSNKIFLKNKNNKLFPSDFFNSLGSNNNNKNSNHQKIIVDLRNEYEEDKELLDLLEGKPSTSKIKTRPNCLKEVIKEEEEDSLFKNKVNNNINDIIKNNGENIVLSVTEKLGKKKYQNNAVKYPFSKITNIDKIDNIENNEIEESLKHLGNKGKFSGSSTLNVPLRAEFNRYNRNNKRESNIIGKDSIIQNKNNGNFEDTIERTGNFKNKNELPFNFKFSIIGKKEEKEQFRLKSSDKVLVNRYSKPKNTNQNGSTFCSSANTNFTNSNKIPSQNNNTASTDDHSKYCFNLLSNYNQNNNILIPLLPLRRPNSNFNFGGDKILDKEEKRGNVLVNKNSIGKINCDNKKKLNINISKKIQQGNKLNLCDMPISPFGGSHNNNPIKIKVEGGDFKRYKMNLPSFKFGDKNKGGNEVNTSSNHSTPLITRNKSVGRAAASNGMSIDSRNIWYQREDRIFNKLHKIKIEKGMAASIIGFRLGKFDINDGNNMK